MKNVALLAILVMLAEANALEAMPNQWTRAERGLPQEAKNSAYDREGKCTYVLTQERWDKPWKITAVKDGGECADYPGSPLLDQVLAKYTAFDPVNKELLVVGPGALPADAGWTVVIACNPATQQWRRLEFGDAAARKAHAARLSALDSAREMVGRTRAYWYPDNNGQGTDEERKDLSERCVALGKLPELAALKADVDKVAGLVNQKQLLDALKAARDLERKFEEAVESASPVPPARLGSPVVVDAANKALVLFGGDREDRLLNDTWILDLEKRQWRRANPKAAPSPRAGHSLAWLPKGGKVVMWSGYVQTNNPGYRTPQGKMVSDPGPWLYDVKTGEWKLLTASGAPPAEGIVIGEFGIVLAAEMSADAADVLHVKVKGADKRPDAFWSMQVDTSRAVEPGNLGSAPNAPLLRTGLFLAAFSEAPDPGKPVNPDELRANTWTLLPPSPRIMSNGQRAKDWSTATWNPDRQEILHWGGGHCCGAYSAPAHWSPRSGRMCEGYDADEQYGHQGSGGFSILGRPFVETHSYRVYAYDPKNKLMVLSKAAGTALYDPLRMDWLKERFAQPFSSYSHCYNTVLASTPHGVVAWAPRGGDHNPRGLWLFDRQKGWQPLKTEVAAAPMTAVDGSGAAYDSKRDRLWMGTNGGYATPGDGCVHSYDFKTGKLEKYTPANVDLGKVYFFRELAYLEHCDWLLPLEVYRKDPKDPKSPALNRVYDCAANKWLLVDFGPDAGKATGAAQGLVYDAKRKLAFSIQNDGRVWALKIDPKTAKIEGGP